MENIETLRDKPVSALTDLAEPYKVLDNKDTYVKSVSPETGKIVIYKTIDPERVERKSGTPIEFDHYHEACAEADKKTTLEEISPFPYFINLDFDKPAFAVHWIVDKDDTQTVYEFFYSGPGAHILDTLHDCLVALPSGWDYYDKPRPAH